MKDKNWQGCGNINPASEKDLELRKELRVNITVTHDTIISRIGLFTPRWLSMKKIMVWVILAKEI